MIEFNLPIKTVSEANCSEHWTVKRKRHKSQQRIIWFAFKQNKSEIKLPCNIKLIRLGKRKLDSDNLPVSMKWIRDAIADHLIPNLAAGKADDDPRLSWEYDQQISKTYGVIVQFNFKL